MPAATKWSRPGASKIRFSNLTRIKLGLIIMAMLVFGYGVRNDIAYMRWIAIGLLAAAYLLRFVNRGIDTSHSGD